MRKEKEIVENEPKQDTEKLLFKLDLDRLEKRFSYGGLLSGGKGGCINCIYYDDVNNKEPVVVKIYISPTEYQLTRLNIEANLLSEFHGVEKFFINRPIIGITPVKKIDNLPIYYLVTEYAEGITLHDYLRKLGFPKKELPWEIAVEISYRIAQALSVVARHGVVHRDLHNRNLIICEYNSNEDLHCTVKQTRIIDFGSGRVESWSREVIDRFYKETGDPTFFLHAGSLYDPRKSWQIIERENDHLYTKRPIGAWSVMAPETIEDPHSVDTKADIWSLGVLFYYMLARRFPFENPHLKSLLDEMYQRKYQPLREVRKDLPGILSDVVDLFLEPDSGRRINHKSIGYILVDLLEVEDDYWETFPKFRQEYVKHHGEVRLCARCSQLSYTPSRCEYCGANFYSEETFLDWATPVSDKRIRIQTVENPTNIIKNVT